MNSRVQKIILALVLILLLSGCDALLDPEHPDTDAAENSLDPTWSGYPIHRGYNVNIHLDQRNAVYLLGINFHTDSYQQILHTDHVNEYDIILEFRASDMDKVIIHSGANMHSSLFKYSDIHDFPEMNTLPDSTQRVQHLTVQADSEQYLLIRNRHDYYSKFLLKEQEWKSVSQNVEYLIRFTFEFYYYLQTEPDLSLH